MNTFAQRLEQALIEYAASHVAFTLRGGSGDIHRTGDALRNLIIEEIARHRAALRGVASCATCEACRNVALKTLDEDYTPDNVAGELLTRAVDEVCSGTAASGEGREIPPSVGQCAAATGSTAPTSTKPFIAAADLLAALRECEMVLDKAVRGEPVMAGPALTAARTAIKTATGLE